MVRLLRHRQTKGAVTDRFDLTPPRHISTLPILGIAAAQRFGDKPHLSDYRKVRLAHPMNYQVHHMDPPGAVNRQVTTFRCDLSEPSQGSGLRLTDNCFERPTGGAGPRPLRRQSVHV
jgi:hypothetical protein